MKWTSRQKGEGVWDAWSWVHLASGAGLRIARVPWTAAMAAIVGFEAVEAGLRRFKVEDNGLFEYESWPNVIGDIVVGAAGYAVAAALGAAVSRRGSRREPPEPVVVAVSRRGGAEPIRAEP